VYKVGAMLVANSGGATWLERPIQPKPSFLKRLFAHMFPPKPVIARKGGEDGLCRQCRSTPVADHDLDLDLCAPCSMRVW
jgi:hypothetical protein